MVWIVGQFPASSAPDLQAPGNIVYDAGNLAETDDVASWEDKPRDTLPKNGRQVVLAQAEKLRCPNDHHLGHTSRGRARRSPLAHVGMVSAGEKTQAFSTRSGVRLRPLGRGRRPTAR